MDLENYDGTAEETIDATDSGLPIRHVVFIGEIGSGKSSVINLFANRNLATVSPDAEPCTRNFASYETIVDGKRYMLWDTPGTDPATSGFGISRRSTRNDSLRLFLQERHRLEGLDLIVLCVRGGMALEGMSRVHRLFCREFRRFTIPVVVAITHLEREQPTMDVWWQHNERKLAKLGLVFDGYACLTCLASHYRGWALQQDIRSLIFELAECGTRVRKSLADVFDELDVRHPAMDFPNHPFFDMQKINTTTKMPLEYGPLIHALSALSVGDGSFATNMPSGSVDNTVSSLQQLLDTLTQTISDLLRLLPRTTWDDSSSFDGVLRDMLKGDDFLDDTANDVVGEEDEGAALTLALERRARWMEVQLSKLEELHRDINTAAVRAVLAFNDSGWDRHAFMPRIDNTSKRFDSIGMVESDGKLRSMTVDELEKELVVAKEAAVFAETELKEAMEKMQGVRPVEVDDF